MKIKSKEMTICLILIIWAMNGYYYISTQQYQSELFWAFVSGGLGATVAILIFLPGIILFVCIPIHLFKNNSLVDFNFWGKINIGLVIGFMISLLLVFSTMKT